MYILECCDGTYYTGSTKFLEKRFWEHQNSIGANYTKKRLPVKLVYFEEYERIDEAFYREKQLQGWSHAKKRALIEGNVENLHKLANCINATHFMNIPLDSARGTLDSARGTLNSTQETLDSTQGTLDSARGTLDSTQGTLDSTRIKPVP